MTRLTNEDICHISNRLSRYEESLVAATGRSMTGIAAHALGRDEQEIRNRLSGFPVHVVPVTAGLGIITDFSETVAAILNFLGCRARVTEQTDATGLVSAYILGAEAVMLADDLTFAGINLHTRKVADNSEATGRVFAAALDLMAGGLRGRKVLIMGCGPVGASAAQWLLRARALPVLFDKDGRAADSLQARLLQDEKNVAVEVLGAFPASLSDYPWILEATPSADTIPDHLIRKSLMISAPGVPLGISENGSRLLSGRLVHDKLELGVAAMAATLVV